MKYIKYIGIFSLNLCLVGILTLIGLEWYLRANTIQAITPGYTQTHPERRYELLPNFVGKTYDVSLKINSLGIRDYEVPILEDHYRIAVFGDSMTFGQGVELKDTFPKILEQKLNYYHNKKIQIFNFGIPSYNTQSEYIYLKDTYDKFRPDLVIIQFTAENDSTILHPDGNKINQYKAISFFKDILRNLYSYNFLAARFYSLIYKVKTDKYSDEYQARLSHDLATYNDDYQGWIDTQKAFKNIKLFTDQKNIPLLFAVFVNNIKLSNQLNTDLFLPIVNKINHALNKAGISHIVLIDDYLREFHGKEKLLWVKPDDSHFSVLAHNLAATSIYKYITKNNLLD